MRILLCEGTLDMEFLARLIESCYNFKRKQVGEDYLRNKLGLQYKRYIVLEGSFELFIFYPKGGGSETVLKTVCMPSQLVQWIVRGVLKIGIAIDLDDKNIDTLINSVETRLKNNYGKVTKTGVYTFKCKINEYNFTLTTVPIGDLSLSDKLGFPVTRHKIEDLILDFALENTFYRHLLTQAIEFYREKMKRDPNQKALVKIMESTCSNPDFGAYELLSVLFKDARNILPSYIFDSLNEFLE